MLTTSRFLPLYRFSANSTIAQKTFAKFQEKHAANMEAFKRKMADANKQGDQVKKSTQKVYVHPFNSSHKPIVPGGMKMLEVERDLLGAEQVSPHYENFSMARKHALFLWGGFIALRWIAGSEDFYLFARNASGAWFFIFAYLYFFVEGKKSFMM